MREEATGRFWELLSDTLVSSSVPANLGPRGQLLLSQELPVGAEEGQVLQGHQGPMGEVKVAAGLTVP